MFCNVGIGEEMRADVPLELYAVHGVLLPPCTLLWLPGIPAIGCDWSRPILINARHRENHLACMSETTAEFRGCIDDLPVATTKGLMQK